MRVNLGLRIKIILLTILTAVLFMVLLSAALVLIDRSATFRSFERSTEKMGELIAIGLERGMIERDLSGVQEMIDSLSGHAGMQRIYVLNKQGEIAISSDRASVGTKLDIGSQTCQACHGISPQSRSKSLTFNKDGERVLRSVVPIANKAQCHACHPSSEKLNGILISEFSTDELHKETHERLLGILIAGAVTFLSLAVVTWFAMDQMILRRLKRLVETVRAMSLGDLDKHVKIEKSDELSELEGSFNIMAANLQGSMNEIRSARDWFADLIDGIQDEILVIDKDFRILTANRAALARLNMDGREILGRLCHEVCYNLDKPCDEQERDCPIRATFAQGKAYSTFRSYLVDGELRHFEQWTAPIRNEGGEIYQVVRISRDVTEYRKLEDQASRADRLVALGRLSAGVAHEINNPIGIIVNRIDCLKKESQPGRCPDSLQSDLDTIAACAWRISETARSLLIFSRDASTAMMPVNVNEAISISLGLVQMEKAERKEIAFNLILREGLPQIRGDLSRLVQCLVYILNNAVDAIPGAGEITVESSRASAERDQICICISDTGVGIEPEHVKKVFDPFYTTKAPGKGTGLGLSISYGIVRDFGGDIEISSIVGKGTSLSILLPTARTSEEDDSN